MLPTWPTTRQSPENAQRRIAAGAQLIAKIGSVVMAVVVQACVAMGLCASSTTLAKFEILFTKDPKRFNER
jgi:hypothetical protein